MDFHEIDEKLVRPAPSMAAVVVCGKIAFGKDCDDPTLIVKEWSQHIQEGHGFAPITGRPFVSAGYLKPTIDKNHLQVTYVKEGSIKHETVEELDLVQKHIRGVAQKVRVQAVINKNGADIRFYGGKEDVLAKAKDSIVASLKATLKRHGIISFKETEPGFTPAQMKIMLDRLGVTTVSNVSISPGECEKLRKFTEEKTKRGETVPKELLFDANIILRGKNVKLSPMATQIINESGVHVDAISCKLTLKGGRKVSARIDSSGRVLIRVSSEIASTHKDFSAIAEEVMTILTGGKVIWHPQTQLYKFTDEATNAKNQTSVPAP